MRAKEFINEAPLPPDWDPGQFQQGTTFKSRLAYALDRAKKLGTGSSRVAMLIEYQGRQTVLKVAKNAKGLAQNEVEASLLSDGYATQLGILIPMIDYDEKNPQPHWVHTELAQKATEKQLCQLMKCQSLGDLTYAARVYGGQVPRKTWQNVLDALPVTFSESDLETLEEYASVLSDLAQSLNVELGDFGRAANWGIYHGKPVIIDVGLNTDVLKQYYSE
ncbi:hypothetical protein UFOVP116_121 [uncultured Caudovirales phage]|uniref:Uncharacterized protein n=1 Tax=uncultured Caudovirales phage TaxID=2100421 RepID=A0A6J5L903_9CAUD|nr:hypothetical protein UFOVP116_121 [uncultured Caudovirales phage]